jgi:diguanylate cyclase (GGDEF)-like protein
MSKGKAETPEYWLDLITDTLAQLDVSARGAFLQKFLQSLAGQGVSEEESITYWEGILARQSQWAEKLGRPVTLRTALVDYFEDIRILRNPVILEYDELKKLRYNAATDPLTGLNNRRMFEEYLDQEIDRSTRYGSPFALLSFDLRNFKSVNDIYGHGAGDEILRSLARASLESLRGSDIPCRIGGDEFAILLPQADRPGAEALAGRIARKFEESARSLAPGTSVGVDYGIAIFPEEGNDATSLVAAADRSLYASKCQARDGPEGRRVAPQAGAPQGEEAAPRIKVAETHRDVHRPPSEQAPAGSAGSGEKVPISANAPDGRRSGRIRLEGVPTLGIVRVGGKSCTVKILDASRGGVCILVDQTDLPETFQAHLEVPTLFGGELALQRVYSVLLPEGKRRVGCRLISIPVPK